MSKEPGRAYEFWNISVVICETNNLYQLTKSLTKRNPWLCSFLVSNTLLSRKSRYEPQALGYRINWEMHTQYAGAAGIVLQINGKLTRKLKSSGFFSSSCVFNQPSLLTSRCRSNYKAYLAVSVVFDLLKSLYSDTKILSKYIPSLQKKL
jgi:hypothetical protein